MNYFDILLAKKLEDNRDPRVEGLSVTENGRYSEDNVVYSPVVVNVAGYKLENLPTGAIASISDGVNLPLADLSVDIKATQAGSGDPSPTNVRAISGFNEVNTVVCGKNILNKIGTNTDNGYINKAYLSDDGSVGSDNNLFVTEYIPLKSSTIYFLSGVSGSARAYCLYDSYKNYISGERYQGRTSFQITTTQNTAYIRLTLHMSETGEQLEEGTTATEYEPYTAKTYSINWETEAGTVYGGYINPISGELTVTHKGVDLGDFTWSANAYDNYAFNGILPFTSVNGNDMEFICSSYVGYKSTVLSSYDYGVAIAQDGTRVYVKNKDYPNTDTDAFKTASQGVILVYKLATPLTYQLTPTLIKTLLGNNNIYADTGDILSGQYFKEL